MSFILFIPLALVATAAAVGVVVARKPVHNALFLLLNFATLAVMYVEPMPSSWPLCRSSFTRGDRGSCFCS